MATSHTNGHQSSREVHQEINRIRNEMDHTLDEIGNYLHPKHLLDYVIDSVRSESPGNTKQKARDIAQQGVDIIKSHPGPAALLGGAVLWYLMERDDDDYRSSGSRWGMPMGSRHRAATYGAWEEGYDWSSSQEDEQTWTEKARGALDQVKTVIADKSIAAKDKVRHVAKHMIGASGKSREEIHAQWANLREHGGSYVDARTGEPYDDSYGDTEWNALTACACLADESGDDSSWSSKAQDTVNAMSESLKNAGSSVKDQFRALGGHITGLASSGTSAVGRAGARARQSMASGYNTAYRGAASGLSSVSDSARHGAHRVSSSVSHGVGRAGDTLSHGVGRASDGFQRALHEQPLAVGAACLGIGLLAGLLAPSTRAENQLMGDAADQLKDQAREAGQEAIERGKQAAAAAANTVAEEAKRQGITPENVANKVAQVADKAKDKAKQSAQRS